MMHGLFNGGPFGYGGGNMGIGMFLVWALVIGVTAYIIYVVVFKNHQNPKTSALEDPMPILGARYARGDISREEYEKLKSEIGG